MNNIFRISFIFFSIISSGLVQAQPKKHEPYMQAAVLGSLATWFYTLAIGAPITNCKYINNNIRLEHGFDEELSIKTVGFFNHECTIQQVDSWRLSYRPMINISEWFGDSTSQYSTSAYDFSIIPMIRWQKSLDFMPSQVDLEIGIGASYLTHTNIGLRKKSTNFQFTDHLGIGLSGNNQNWRIGLNFRHVSNSGIKLPNNGVDFFGISFDLKM